MKKLLPLMLVLMALAGLIMGYGERALATEKGETAICTTYDAYVKARDAFDRYALEESRAHEVVSVNISLVTAFDLRIFNYLLPLSYIGQSISTMGHYDEGIETMMLRIGWADDAELTNHDDGSLSLTGTSHDGSVLNLRIHYLPEQDQLRLEALQDETTVLLFEYAKNGDGYIAQYYFNEIVGHDWGSAIWKMCVYKTFFSGNNGSAARFDGVEEPETILGTTFSEQDFIAGATHWFTLVDGKFSGNLNGKVF